MRAAGWPSVSQKEPISPYMSPSLQNNREPPNFTEWDSQHEQCLLFIEYSPSALPTDRWLVQYSRAERLCHDIVDQMCLNDPSSCYDISQPDMKIKIQSCKTQILNWKLKVPQALCTPTLLLWEYVATAYMYEVVLHTPSNKRSFAAPYVAEKLSWSDFHSPIVTQDHITAVYELLAALHAIIDTITSLDARTLIALPSLMYAWQATYANYVLAKLYIAITAPGNTLGSILEPCTLRAEEYCDKLAALGIRVKAVEEYCAPAQMLVGTIRLRDWYTSYNSSLLSGNGLAAEMNNFEVSVSTPNTGLQTQPAAAWTSLLPDNATEFGLDMLFAEPITFETFVNLPE